MLKIQRAILSVSDKSDLLSFARGLVHLGVEIISTGGTARSLKEGGLQVVDVSDLTGFPEMLDGRVKTLHPIIHGGILARKDLDSHTEQLKANGIEPIDLVAVNLYPFPQVVSDKSCTLEKAVENIDIGGPTLIRAAAKNYEGVVVIVDTTDYQSILNEMRASGGSVSRPTRWKLAKKAFAITAAYDKSISESLPRWDEQERC
jgi:phosphoribosylaminoimidazolecarboxamide formyltransferase/IMP cyclohydrolase